MENNDINDYINNILFLKHAKTINNKKSLKCDISKIVQLDSSSNYNNNKNIIKTGQINLINNSSIKKSNTDKLLNNKKIYLMQKAQYYLIKIFFFSLLIINCSCIPNGNCNLRKTSTMNELILTIYHDAEGYVKIFHDDFKYFPDEIYINGNKIDDPYSIVGSDSNEISLPSGENIVNLYYNEVPDSLEKMFNNVYNVKEIDLSHFDTSEVNNMFKMFNYCHDLEKINLTNFDTSKVTTMEGMFEGCKKITSLDLSSFRTSLVTTMKYMFKTCEELQYLNIENFDTSSVTDIAIMFQECKKLESIDISSFSINNADMGGMFQNCQNLKSINFPDTKKIKASNMGAMFQDCWALTSLNLSCFDTSSLESLDYIFVNCYELASVDLSSFDTSGIKSFEKMFSNCKKLESLNLANFITTSATTFGEMFSGCESLKYLNLDSFYINQDAYIGNMFRDISNLTIFCYKNDDADKINQEYENLKNDCENPCFLGDTKLISELYECVDDCSAYSTYQYEYNNKCYSTCPEGTQPSSNNLCLKTLECSIYSNIDKTECFDEIPVGYYIFDEQQKIIDKCHDSCLTCNKKEEEGNTNCLTCKNDYFLYNGNCFENCQYGDYTENSIKKCTCLSNSKCKICPDENLNSNLCISCNQGYYPKYEENRDPGTLIDCYDTLEKYYLKDEYFYPCYSSCQKCFYSGDSDNHNCDECLPNYKVINELNKPNNCYEECTHYYYIEDNEYKCTETNSCNNQQKLIREKFKCIDNCIDDDTYKLEYNNECVQTCPGDTIKENNKCIERTEETTQENNSESDTIENTDTETSAEDNSQSNTNENTETETSEKDNTQTDKIGNTDKQTIESTQNNINEQTNKAAQEENNSETDDNWSSKNFFLGLYNNDEKNNSLTKDEIIKNIREDIINGNLDTVIDNVVKEKEDVFIKKDNTLFQITTSENQNNNTYSNVSTIKLGDCERILRGKYDIKDNETLIILKIDYNITGLLIPIIGYEVYHPRNKSKLDLSYCEESSISYNIPVSIDEEKLYKHDPNSEYYNDECSAYTTENGTDILLNDRKEEFNDNNMSLCENICDYVGYDLETKKALCECGIRYEELLLSEVDNQTDLLANNFTTDNSTSNIGAMKCYDLVFSKDGLLSNIGSYILILIVILHLISIIVFYKCGYQILDTTIQDMIDDKKKIKKMEKKAKMKNNKNSNKNNIYLMSQQGKKSKKKVIKFEKPKKKKKKLKANPSKKEKKKNSGKNINHENTNLSSNQKSFTKLKLKLKDNKVITNYEKEQSGSIHVFQKKSNSNDNVNKKIKILNILDFNDFELNTMDYKNALEIDKRTYSEYYISLIKTKHPILFSFCPRKDFNVFIIRICLFFLYFAINYAFNTLFFDFTVIHNIYENEGNYDISFLIPQIIYSFIISYIIFIFIKFFTLSERDLIKIKNEKTIIQANEKVPSVERCIIIRNICYFILSILFLFFFWYYLSSFCALYKNSQVHLIKNTFISFAIGLIFPFFINLLPGIFRIFSLQSTNRECLYKTSQILQLL